jgi:hypothetical protein
MRATTACRLKVAALPVMVPITLVFNLVIALSTGFLRAVEVFCNFCADDIHNIHHHIVRPAIYGHVDDYPEVK